MHECARCGEPAPDRRSYCDACEEFFARPQHEPGPDVQLRQLRDKARLLRARLAGTAEKSARRLLRDELVRNLEARDRIEEAIARAAGDGGAEAPAHPEKE